MRAVIATAASAMAAAIITAPVASADAEPSPAVIAYAAYYGGVVCDVLDEYPTVSGLLGVMEAVENDGFTAYEAGQVVGMSVAEICPRHGRLLRQFVDIYGGSRVA